MKPLGRTVGNGKAIDVEAAQKLSDMGFDLCIAAEALRQVLFRPALECDPPKSATFPLCTEWKRVYICVDKTLRRKRRLRHFSNCLSGSALECHPYAYIPGLSEKCLPVAAPCGMRQ